MSYQRDFLARKLRDPQAKFVHDLAQIQANQAAENVSFITSNLKGYSIKVQTKTTSKDKYYLDMNQLNDDDFFTGRYPDYDNCRLFLRTENAGKLHDYSLMGNEAYSYGTRQAPEVFVKEDPNDPAKHEFVAYHNGTHYVIVKDHSRINMKDIVEDEPTKAGFTFVRRWNPMKAGNSVQDSIIVAQKTDTSQNRYGYSLNLDHEGNFFFYVKYNYRQYFAKLNSNIPFYTTTEGNFFYENFRPENFKTDASQIQDLTRYSLDIACSFNFTTKEVIIELRSHNAKTNTWQMVGRVSSITEAIPDLQLHLPLQEGKWSAVEATPLNQVYDVSPNAFVGTILNPTASGAWQSDNTFKNAKSTAGTYFSIPNHANLNTLTEFSLSFWVRFDNVINDATFRYIFNKGWSGNGSIVVYRSPNSDVLTFAFKNDAGVTVVRTFSGAVTDTNWHFYSIRWKTGEFMKVSKDNVEGNSSTVGSGSLTNSSNLYIHSPSGTDQQQIINFRFFKRQITTLEQTKLFNYGPHLAQFPQSKEPQIQPSQTPAPITVPYTLLYDLPRITVPTLSDYLFMNNPSADNPFVPKYNCADGTAAVTPQENKYNVPEGSGGTSQAPFTTIYNLAGASSTGTIEDSVPEMVYAQYIQHANSTLDARVVTEIQVWLNGLGNPTGGSVYLGIIKANGTYITLGTAIDPASIPDAWTSYTKTLTTQSYSTVVGDGIGVIWVGHTEGDVNVRRAGSGVHYSTETSDDTNGDYSCQNHLEDDGTWSTPNEEWAMAGVIKIGGNTIGTTPYYTLIQSSNTANYQSIVGELFGASSNMANLPPSKVELKGYKKAGTTGTLALQLVTAAGVLKAGGTLKTWDIASDAAISTTAPAAGVFNLVWENVDNLITIAAGERLTLACSTFNTGGEFYVMTNLGNNSGVNNYNAATSYRTNRNQAGTWGSSTTLDLSGKVYVGGANFTAYKRFSATLTRIYERALTTASSFKLPDPITQVKVRGRRVGTIPAPALIGCYIRRQSDNAVQETIEVKDASAIGTTLQDIFFENRAADYLVAVGDYISIEVSGCTPTQYIELNINNNVADSTNSVLGVYENNVANDLSNYDLAGTFFTGGQVDALSRTRVGQFINTQNSLLITAPNNSVTYMELAMIKVGTPTGNFVVNIRNEDDAAIKTLHTAPVSGLSATVNSPTIVFVNDLTNTYILKPKDKIVIEYDGGDTNNKIGVMVRTSSPNYDVTNSYVTRSNGIEYDYDETKDLCAVMKVGGYTYTPDPGALPPNMPQLSTDLYLGVSGDKEGLYEKSLTDLFMFTTEILTTFQLDNFIKLRVDIEDAEPHELLVTHHTFIHAE